MQKHPLSCSDISAPREMLAVGLTLNTVNVIRTSLSETRSDEAVERFHFTFPAFDNETSQVGGIDTGGRWRAGVGGGADVTECTRFKRFTCQDFL